MKIKIPITLLILTVLFSCEFDKSVSKDLTIGLTAEGDGLSCNDIYLSVGDEKVRRNSFTYGEIFLLNFNNMKGFEKENEFVFPGLKLLISGKEGDTILFSQDLYADNSNGYDLSPLLLFSKITVGSPMHSNNKYHVNIDIWDKKGTGTYSAEMDFDVKANDHIKIENNNISYDEIYLFSQARGVSLTENEVKLNETTYMIFEGLEGFQQENGQAFIGVQLTAKDADGKMLIDEKDLMGDAGTSIAELKNQLAPNFIFSGVIKNPVDCEILVWDKKSDHKIKTSVSLNIK